MRPTTIFSVALGLVGAFALVVAAVPRLAAQDAAESAVTKAELAPGVFAEVFVGAPSDRAAGQTVYTARFTFEPGGEIFPHGHPGTVVLSVDSGTFGWTLVQGTAYVVRGAGTGGTEVETVTEAGAEVILDPGAGRLHLLRRGRGPHRARSRRHGGGDPGDAGPGGRGAAPDDGRGDVRDGHGRHAGVVGGRPSPVDSHRSNAILPAGVGRERPRPASFCVIRSS
jgi:hypothetical protein